MKGTFKAAFEIDKLSEINFFLKGRSLDLRRDVLTFKAFALGFVVKVQR